ncbi:hypothetical protein GR217_22785 [Rhizobium leguminosarum]|uniref:Uncharacterized protein n=1 Tax=Rhizobium ruizarguesonis TaxID=2081791 RepID=A0AAE4YSN5_9HYPH|nr:hypothetical protein [Rhizobium ruizarguesonis]NEI50514.1 hypothetical protein [Rhizobium ruizarguesonis]
MKSFRSMGLAIALNALLGTSAGAQDTKNAMLFDYPTAAISQLGRADAPEVAKAAGVISSEWNFIEDSFRNIGSPSKNFRLAMNHNKELLQTAADDPNGKLSMELVGYVEEDLAIKSNYIRGRSTQATVSAAIYSEVAVDVRTMKNGGEIDGYIIGFSPRHMAGSDPLIKFNNPTNPSEGSLPPGRYEMMAILNNQVVQRQEVSIGILGQKGEPIICLVP